MRTLTYYAATTLDGFIAGPKGGDPTGPDGFFTVTPDYLEHIVTHYPETLPAPARAALGVTASGTRFDTVLEGRRSYQLGLDAGITDAYPHLRHYVFSRSLTKSPDAAVEVVSTDPLEKVRELKSQDGKGIWLVGGAELAGALYPEIDELVLKVNPVTIGAGIPLFAGKSETNPRAFTMIGHTVLPCGAAFLTYTTRP